MVTQCPEQGYFGFYVQRLFPAVDIQVDHGGSSANERELQPRLAIGRQIFHVCLIDKVCDATNGDHALGSPQFQDQVAAALGRRPARSKSGRPRIGIDASMDELCRVFFDDANPMWFLLRGASPSQGIGTVGNKLSIRPVKYREGVLQVATDGTLTKVLMWRMVLEIGGKENNRIREVD